MTQDSSLRNVAPLANVVRLTTLVQRCDARSSGLPGATRLEDYLTLGLLTSSDVAKLRELLNAEVAGFDYSLSRSAILHVMKRHGAGGTELQRGQLPVDVADFVDLLALLASPDEVFASGAELVFMKRTAKGAIRATFQRLAKRRMLNLVTFWIGK